MAADNAKLRAILHRIYERVMIPIDPISDAALIARELLIYSLVDATVSEFMAVQAEIRAAAELRSTTPAGHA